MKDSEVIVTTIKNVTQMVNTGNENAILAMAIRGASQAKLFADFSQGYQTGQTKNSIQYLTGRGLTGGLNDSQGDKATEKLNVPLKSNEAAVGATSAHAYYPEFGTTKMAPQPYIRPSLAIVGGDAPEVVAAKMKYEIAKGVLEYGQSRVKF